MRNLALLVSILLPVTIHGSENEALKLAYDDIQTLPRLERLFTRYIWITVPDFEDIQATSLVLNYISRGTAILRPYYRSNGKGTIVIRVPLRGYAPKSKDLDDLVRVWENFQFDPKFNFNLTKDTLKFTGIVVETDKITVMEKVKRTKQVLKDVPGYVVDGKYYNQKYVEEEYEETIEKIVERDPFDGVEVLRVVSDHIDKDVLAKLIDETQSQAPIVNHNYFIRRAISTIKGKGAFKVIYGGLYYDLSGIKTGFKKGTDEDNFLAGLGIGNIEQKIDAKKVFDSIPSDQRVAIFRSGVTGKPRRIDILRTLAGRDNQGIVSFTHDLKDEDIDIGTHPIMNLVDFKDAAREVLFEKLNGLQSGVLFNGEGVRQDEVPPDVAADTTIPSPYGTRLEPFIGCLRCHFKEDGWRVSNNDVKRLLGGPLDTFGDRSNPNTPEVIDRLAGLYAGDLEFKIFPRARNDYASAVLRATGPWKRSKDQTNIIKLANEKISEIYKRYQYTEITPVIALEELGQDSKADLRKLLPPVDLRKYLPPNLRFLIQDDFVREDPRIGALLKGISINRSDWDLIYSSVATRIRKPK